MCQPSDFSTESYIRERATRDTHLSSRKTQKAAARAARLADEAQAATAARRKRRTIRIGGALALVTGLVVAILVLGITSDGPKAPAQSPGAGSQPELRTTSIVSLGRLQAPPSQAALGPEGIPLVPGRALAGTERMASGQPVDRIGCLGQEQTLFHIHAHLTVFVGGTARSIPYGIGITHPELQNTPLGAFVGGGTCFYFLHTHASDGIIHIESPVKRTYTLGDFFDIWGQPLSRNQIGPAAGHVTAFYDGRLYTGNPRDIPLNRHAQIQLDSGRPLIAPVRLRSWAQL